ncbi:MAG: endonuclease domain-containing protein [Candidatus Doudnabacteria bacterium]|nr:endonuclease domain-containing protein [Candidatus Doudnabacteria bacterium]
MSYLYNSLSIKQKRRELRKNQTDCEALLWSVLRNKQCNGHKFLRQYSVGKYILDFFCPKLRLAIELDGSQHQQQKDYDQERTNFLKAHNIKVLRFWDNEVLENLEGVYERILKHCL